MKHTVILHLEHFGHTRFDAEGATFEEARKEAIKEMEAKGWKVLSARPLPAPLSDTELAAQNEDN